MKSKNQRPTTHSDTDVGIKVMVPVAQWTPQTARTIEGRRCLKCMFYGGVNAIDNMQIITCDASPLTFWVTNDPCTMVKCSYFKRAK